MLVESQEMADASTRTIQVWETPYDLKYLTENGWTFNIAKSVTKPDGSVFYNIIWQSKALAPNIHISWNAIYAFNWTASIPADGVTVTTNGRWQECRKGEVFDLNSAGDFVRSEAVSSPGYMKVGNIGYNYPGVPGIHIIVGVQNTSGGFDVIFVDPVALPPNCSARYQPQEKVKWWYETGLSSATIITEEITNGEEQDLSTPNSNNDYYYSTTFKYDTGRWSTSGSKPSDLHNY